MKKIKIWYWVFTILFAGLMFFSAIPDVMVSKDAINIVTDMLGYPKYFIAFIGVAKVLGVIAILIPGFPRIKEWAYAGLFFDLIGATYSGLAKGGFQLPMLGMLVFFIPGILSYVFYHKKISTVD
ncbi:DoxX family protein [Ferruginibacter albus]|uniref:DoxX family protein n=1 Tax=Ferruginibacter albus TaxID=2875540 RepID=UPI001CC7DF83|nr:DoxX family protein [Ferruginibacter albus]UAY51121.1 DoxX family protein [Ferruginibacter albus]